MFLLVCVLAAFASGQSLLPEDSRPVRRNDIWVRVDPYCPRLGITQSGREYWPGASAAFVQLEWNRFRFGIAAAEEGLGIEAIVGNSYLPLRLGYTIWRHPVGYFWRLGGMVPEVATELALNWWNSDYGDWMRMPVAVRADAVVGADMLGLGFSLAAGVMYFQTSNGDNGSTWVEHHEFLPNLELRFRPATFAFHLTSNPPRRQATPGGVLSDSSSLRPGSPWPVAGSSHVRFGTSKPTWLLRTEILSYGYDAIEGLYGKHYVTSSSALSFISAEAEWWRLRLGLGIMHKFEESTYGIFPLSIGFTIWQRPYNYAGRLFGKKPEVYVKLTNEGAILNDPPPYIEVGTLELVGAVDGYGAGLMAMVGVRGARSDYPHVFPKPIYSFDHFIGIRVRLLTLTAGF